MDDQDKQPCTCDHGAGVHGPGGCTIKLAGLGPCLCLHTGPAMTTSTGDVIGRRCHTDLMTNAELACLGAIQAIENLRPDPRLTEAQILIGRAQNLVADFVDGIPVPPVDGR